MPDTGRENYVPLVMTAHGWASGNEPSTPFEDVINRLKREWGSSHIKKYGYVVYLVHPKFEISEIDGTIYTPKGHPPIKIEDRTRVEGVKVKK